MNFVLPCWLGLFLSLVSRVLIFWNLSVLNCSQFWRIFPKRQNNIYSWVPVFRFPVLIWTWKLKVLFDLLSTLRCEVAKIPRCSIAIRTTRTGGKRREMRSCREPRSTRVRLVVFWRRSTVKIYSNYPIDKNVNIKQCYRFTFWVWKDRMWHILLFQNDLHNHSLTIVLKNMRTSDLNPGFYFCFISFSNSFVNEHLFALCK